MILQTDFNSSSLFLALFTSSCLLTKLKKGFKKSKKCIVWLFYFHNFGQLIYSTHLTDLVDDSKQQQSVKNSDDDWSIDPRPPKAFSDFSGQATISIWDVSFLLVFLFMNGVFSLFAFWDLSWPLFSQQKKHCTIIISHFDRSHFFNFLPFGTRDLTSVAQAATAFG